MRGLATVLAALPLLDGAVPKRAGDERRRTLQRHLGE